MLDLRRYRGVAEAGAWVGLAALALNFSLFLGFGRAPRWLVLPRTPLGWQEVERIEQGLAGLAVLARRGELGQDSRLNIYIGMSTAREGIDPVRLSRVEGQGRRYVGLCGSGGDVNNLMGITNLLVRSGVRPERVIIALHASWLVGMTTVPDSTSPNPLSSLRSRHWRDAARAFKQWDWIRLNEVNVNHRVRVKLYAARMRVFEGLGLGLEAFSPPSPDPWGLPPRMGYPQHAEAEFLRKQLQECEARGWFDPEAYEELDPARHEILPRVVSRLRDLGTEVVILIMPEQSALRSRVPDVAVSLLTEDLERVQSAPVPIMDFRSMIPDSEFTDYFHLNDSGRADLSEKLGRRLQSSRPPGR